MSDSSDPQRPDELRPDPPSPDEVNRRTFLRDAGLFTASALALGGGLELLTRRPGAVTAQPLPADLAPAPPVHVPSGPFSTSEPPTPYAQATGYNNFYEFGLDKADPARNAGSLRTRPWTVTVDGEVAKPQTLDVDTLLRLFPPEDRVYRMRCVEGWSMVMPWQGFALEALLRRVEPTAQARYVAFTALHDPEQMPGQRSGVLPWPYVEGLRLDEAMHPLTLLATGLYGRALPNQNGAPLRLVVPWKYGFKSIKSVVRVTLTREQPPTTWSLAAPDEYGFYANVNPDVPHPRWSQATERRIGAAGLGDFGRQPTLPFNGYAEQVAHLYRDMDLRRSF